MPEREGREGWREGQRAAGPPRVLFMVSLEGLCSPNPGLYPELMTSWGLGSLGPGRTRNQHSYLGLGHTAGPAFPPLLQIFCLRYVLSRLPGPSPWGCLLGRQVRPARAGVPAFPGRPSPRRLRSVAQVKSHPALTRPPCLMPTEGKTVPWTSPAINGGRAPRSQRGGSCAPRPTDRGPHPHGPGRAVCPGLSQRPPAVAPIPAPAGSQPPSLLSCAEAAGLWTPLPAEPRPTPPRTPTEPPPATACSP